MSGLENEQRDRRVLPVAWWAFGVLLGVALLVGMIRRGSPSGAADVVVGAASSETPGSALPAPAPAGSHDPASGGRRFNPLPEHRREAAQPTAEQAEEIARLKALGYVAGSTAGRGRSGVTIHEPDQTDPGPNLTSDGHAARAVLMDMHGVVLHTWEYPFRKAFPDRPLHKRAEDYGFFRRVHLFENGDLLAIYEGQGLIKIDRDSKLLWLYPEAAHHDLHVAQDGSISVLIREVGMLPRVHPTRPTLHDSIAILDPDGQELRRVSILDALERSRFNQLLPQPSPGGDILHTNTLEILDGRLASRIPAFAAGNALVSILRLNALAVVDLQREVVVWAMKGGWFEQHDPTVLANGNLLLFDNGRRFSRVWEIEPVERKIAWIYGGEDVDFYSRTCGLAQRLDNGNTLITETDQGRAFEVTPDKRIVWEFHTPHRAGPENTLIASLFQVERLPADFPLDWARGASHRR